MDRPGPVSVVFLHTNDHYDVKPRAANPVGGAARMVHMHNELREQAELSPEQRVIVTFGGDILFPSLLSTTTKGAHMMPILNNMGVHVSTFGNHEFDAGIDNVIEQLQKTKFPWLMSNCDDRTTQDASGDALPLGGGQLIHVMERQGLRIGFMGLIEREWLATLSHVEPENVEYTDFVVAAKNLNRLLREEEACDVVVALTHMRVPNDRRLAEEVPELDLILGGHDHSCVMESVNGVVIAKSGSDFSHLTRLTLTVNQQGGEQSVLHHAAVGGKQLPAPLEEACEASADFDNGRGVRVYAERFAANAAVGEDEATLEVVAEHSGALEQQLNVIVGVLGNPIDARFNKIRTQETTAANFVADLMRLSVGADVCLVNCGTLRADRILTAGPLILRDIMELLPMQDPIVKLSITGEGILDALENGVSQHPALEGRFPAVSGISFAFRSKVPQGSKRVVRESVQINGAPLDPDRKYTLATKAYLARGKDGYTAFENCEVLIDDEQGPTIPNTLRTHFDLLAALNAFRPAVDATSRHQAMRLRSQATMRHRLRCEDDSDAAAAIRQQLQYAADAAVAAVGAFGAEGVSAGSTAPTAEEEEEAFRDSPSTPGADDEGDPFEGLVQGTPVDGGGDEDEDDDANEVDFEAPAFDMRAAAAEARAKPSPRPAASQQPAAPADDQPARPRLMRAASAPTTRPSDANALGERLHFHTSPEELAKLFHMQGTHSRRRARIMAAAGVTGVLQYVMDKVSVNGGRPQPKPGVHVGRAASVPEAISTQFGPSGVATLSPVVAGVMGQRSVLRANSPARGGTPVGFSLSPEVSAQAEGLAQRDSSASTGSPGAETSPSEGPLPQPPPMLTPSRLATPQVVMSAPTYLHRIGQSAERLGELPSGGDRGPGGIPVSRVHSLPDSASRIRSAALSSWASERLRHRVELAKKNAALGGHVASLLQRRSGEYLIYRAARLLAMSPSLRQLRTPHSTMLMASRPFRGEPGVPERQAKFKGMVERLQQSGQWTNEHHKLHRLIHASSVSPGIDSAGGGAAAAGAAAAAAAAAGAPAHDVPVEVGEIVDEAALMGGEDPKHPHGRMRRARRASVEGAQRGWHALRGLVGSHAMRKLAQQLSEGESPPVHTPDTDDSASVAGDLPLAPALAAGEVPEVPAPVQTPTRLPTPLAAASLEASPAFGPTSAGILGEVPAAGGGGGACDLPELSLGSSAAGGIPVTPPALQSLPLPVLDCGLAEVARSSTGAHTVFMAAPRIGLQRRITCLDWTDE